MMSQRLAMNWAARLFLPITLFVCSPALGQHTQADRRESIPQIVEGAKRIVFLGDSITYAGHYVTFVDAWLTATQDSPPGILNLGLPSETVSGLSEDGHAGGRFPRPDLGERLERVLSTTKPDLVIACYGINCGIYRRFSEDRFAHFQRGLKSLDTAVQAADAKLILITPPSYDDARAKRDFSYDAVLDRYAEWMLEQQDHGWNVIDLHSAMTAEVVRRRETEPDFTFQPDAVHPNKQGHWFIAQQLIRAFGDEQSAANATPEELLKGRGSAEDLLPLLQKRMNVRRNAYLQAAGHKRPGITGGLPVDAAEERAEQITEQIRQHLGSDCLSLNKR